MRRLALLIGLLVALAPASAPVRADDILLREASLYVTEEGLVLNCDFDFDLSPRLEEAVANGVPLYFQVEFELTRGRWYWFDDQTASAALQSRLSYHALSRQYRVSTGELQLHFSTLREALEVLQRVRAWLVAHRGSLSVDTQYQAGVRMRLDTTQLPKPLQLSALTSRDLHLESAWKRFPFRAAALPPAPVESRVPKEAPQK